MTKVICALTVVLLLSVTALAQESATDDTAAIRATALNYIEGWYEGDAARMESALLQPNDVQSKRLVNRFHGINIPLKR